MPGILTVFRQKSGDPRIAYSNDHEPTIPKRAQSSPNKNEPKGKQWFKKPRWWMIGIAVGLCLLLLAALTAPTGQVASELVFEAMSCQRMPCFISMDSVITGFSWDTMYVFDPSVDVRQVANALGTPPPKFKDGYLKIAFVNRGKLVHFEEENYGLEKSQHNRIVFILPKDKHFGAFSPSTVFNVSEGELKDGKYLVLWDFCHLEDDGQTYKGLCPMLE